MATRKEVTKSLIDAAKYWADKSVSGDYNSTGAEQCAKASKDFVETAKELQYIDDSCFDSDEGADDN